MNQLAPTQMKRIIPLLLTCLCGCTSTPLLINRQQTTTTMMVGTNEVTTVNNSFNLSFKRISALQKYRIPELTVSTNFTLTLKGYDNDGGNQAIESITRAAVEGAVKGSKGGL